MAKPPNKIIKMKKYIWVIVLILIVGFLGAAVFYFKTKKQSATPTQTPPQQTPASTPEVKKEIYPPLDNAKARVTKKPFGIYITPQTSPVQPERFKGFHTGTDFEITPDELEKKIPVFAITDGKILRKEIVSGYGGVIIQSGTISGSSITILYGHINIAQSGVEVGQEIKGGAKIAILADDKSYYSDGERKHLHLGIHKGEEVDLRGYVDSKDQLDNWINIESLL